MPPTSLPITVVLAVGDGVVYRRKIQIFLLPKSHHRPTCPWLEAIQGLQDYGWQKMLMPEVECMSMATLGSLNGLGVRQRPHWATHNLDCARGGGGGAACVAPCSPKG